MRQQVNVTVNLTFDADAALSGTDLRTAIYAELAKLLDAEPLPGRAVLVGRSIASLQEEADIYGAMGK